MISPRIAPHSPIASEPTKGGRERAFGKGRQKEEEL